MLELPHVIVTDYYRAVRIAEDDLRAHVDEFIHEEQTALKHLLMNQYGSLSLSSHHQQYGQQVGRQTRPGRISYRQD